MEREDHYGVLSFSLKEKITKREEREREMQGENGNAKLFPRSSRVNAEKSLTAIGMKYEPGS